MLAIYYYKKNFFIPNFKFYFKTYQSLIKVREKLNPELYKCISRIRYIRATFNTLSDSNPTIISIILVDD